MGLEEMAVAMTDWRCRRFTPPLKLRQSPACWRRSSHALVLLGSSLCLCSYKSLQQMHIQTTTEGILGVGLGLSCSRGRENRKNTCNWCNKTVRQAKAAFTAGFIMVKALWQQSFPLLTPASRGLIQEQLISFLFIFLNLVQDCCPVTSAKWEVKPC